MHMKRLSRMAPHPADMHSWSGWTSTLWLPLARIRCMCAWGTGMGTRVRQGKRWLGRCCFLNASRVRVGTPGGAHRHGRAQALASLHVIVRRGARGLRGREPRHQPALHGVHREEVLRDREVDVAIGALGGVEGLGHGAEERVEVAERGTRGGGAACGEAVRRGHRRQLFIVGHCSHSCVARSGFNERFELT